MGIEELLEKYRGEKVNINELSPYDQFSLTYFVDETKIKEPNGDMTVLFDISDAVTAYKQHFANASFGCFLVWSMMRCLQSVPVLNYRYINNEWYEFKNLPVFIPVATNSTVASRLASVVLENVVDSTWDEFATLYLSKINKAKYGLEQVAIDQDVYSIAMNIVYFPKLYFTALSPHKSAKQYARPTVVMGATMPQGNKAVIPISMAAHHANADGVVLGWAIANLQRHFKGLVADKNFDIRLPTAANSDELASTATFRAKL